MNAGLEAERAIALHPFIQDNLRLAHILDMSTPQTNMFTTATRVSMMIVSSDLHLHRTRVMLVML